EDARSRPGQTRTVNAAFARFPASRRPAESDGDRRLGVYLLPAGHAIQCGVPHNPNSHRQFRHIRGRGQAMRWAQLHIPTLREDPADADVASHRLLLRAGFIRQLIAGHYFLLPLAVRVRAKIMTVIREEMNRIGAQEFLVPSLQSAQLWEKSGRLE